MHCSRICAICARQHDGPALFSSEVALYVLYVLIARSALPLPLAGSYTCPINLIFVVSLLIALVSIRALHELRGCVSVQGCVWGKTWSEAAWNVGGWAGQSPPIVPRLFSLWKSLLNTTSVTAGFKLLQLWEWPQLRRQGDEQVLKTFSEQLRNLVCVLGLISWCVPFRYLFQWSVPAGDAVIVP